MKAGIQEYINKAREEILNPAFEMTKQYLEVNKVELDNGLPKVERVDLDYSDSFVAVYFPIKNERYFLEIHLTKELEIKIHFVYIESGHRTYLTATSEKLTYQELSQFLTFKPLKGWSKDDLRNGKLKYKFSRVSFEPIESEAYRLEKQLDILLTELEKDIESVRNLSKNATTYISVCKHQYVSSNAGISFDIKTINRLSNLNLGIDIDTYIVGDPIKYDGN